ncbi:hypothetical protein BDQ12DRAFT_687761 [Crucibulum laeve]|uniref:Secreted protein n=1 Tax=Crucibulum laeve TaxID=68775 RepID=A0A5C3LSU4_9AGAR|nr:hypothetical protein BDQ12DRAFT_687761 [Crucibulum laeve]
MTCWLYCVYQPLTLLSPIAVACCGPRAPFRLALPSLPPRAHSPAQPLTHCSFAPLRPSFVCSGLVPYSNSCLKLPFHPLLANHLHSLRSLVTYPLPRSLLPAGRSRPLAVCACPVSCCTI